MSMTDAEIEEIEKREQNATPGPRSGLQYFWGINGADKNLVVRDMGVGRNAKENQANQDFIAHAREDIPALIAEVRRLRAVVEQYADHKNWTKSSYIHWLDITIPCNEWSKNEHGWTKAENVLKDGGE